MCHSSSRPLIHLLTILIHTTVRSGYPPTSLTLIPALPITSLGIKKGDQIIVTESISRGTTFSPVRPIGGTGSAAGVNPPKTSGEQSMLGRQALGDDYVQTEGGVLVHRVYY